MMQAPPGMIIYQQGLGPQGYVGQPSFATHQMMQPQQYMGQPPPGPAIDGAMGGQGGYGHHQNRGGLMYGGGATQGGAGPPAMPPSVCCIQPFITVFVFCFFP